ncbi:nuclear transport factor 2 family protein [Aestuariivita sp.]|jgi:phenylpyruvate tautomerase PptA (4-oxalocrotonate tautomerase family)|uniref:nuclear transport factor 2 family protein n=1 Tax=Aestuariivita sp. TaxID=1872407 RepID=UPI00216C79C6|nr:nuclear transport factor 2 family protein [Aestuariivita sp.]MCE8006016.1 SnoaL-like domain-containing protein [Aestuariivita sp.]
MPIVEIHILEGYGPQDKARLGRAVSDAVRSVVPADPEAITVITRDIPHANYLRGGQARVPAAALPDPVAIVRDYLEAMEARDLDRAEAHLAPGFTMQFPGADPMSTLAELIDWARPRYRFVKKTYAGFDASAGDQGTVVHCHGTLHGEWPNGAAFEGIRFIDRFELSKGRILRQDVWNDIAEMRP